MTRPGGIDRYESIEVKYISGHNPDLVIKHGEDVVERIDLKPYDTVDKIQNLLREKNFTKKVEECDDAHIYCNDWKRKGECENNSDFMQKNCQKSCGFCSKVEL